MARAYGVEGDYNYMFAYMNSLLDPEKIKTPEWGEVDVMQITDRESLAETFEMHLSDDMFEAVASGKKNVEVRLFDEKRKLIDIDDYIEFIKSGDENQRVLRRVTNLYVFEDFKELFEREEYIGDRKWRKSLRFSPEEVGSPAGSTAADMVKAMQKYYDKKQVKKYGVMAFRLEKPCRKCRTSLCVGFDVGDGADIYLQRLEQEMSDEELRKLEDERFDGMLIEETFSELSEDYERRGRYIEFGINERYDDDINVMLKRTLKDFFGKEEKLRELRYRFCVSLTLKVNTAVCKDAGGSGQNLTVDSEIEEFLKKSDATLEIKKREL